MFGDNMMIAPVTKEVNKEDGYATLKVWLPEGKWLEYETGQMLQGNDVYKRRFTMDEYPVYVKAGSILPYYGTVKNLSGTEQPVIVRVFPGADKDEFTLYEDNGEDKNYVTEYATTPLSYQRNGAKLTVTIGARKGNYKDMPASRDYSIALPCQKAPVSARVNGKDMPFTYDGLNLEASIALGKIDCSKGATVEVTFPSADYAVTDGEKGQFHRIQNAVQDFKAHDPNMVYTEGLGYLEATPLRLSYHPEKQQETLDRFHQFYKRLPVVLIEQMGKGENFDRFLRQLDESDNMLSEVTAEAFSTAVGTGFDLRFFPNMKMEGEVKATGHAKEIDMFHSGSPTQGIPENYWSMIAESTFTAPETGEVIFILSGDDAYRLILDGKEILSDWGNHAETTRNATVSVEKGKQYNVRIEYYDNEYNGILKLKTLMIK